MAETSEIAISMLVFGSALSMLLMGLLISYYGSSKTRNVGIVFLVLGIWGKCLLELSASKAIYQIGMFLM